MDISAISYNRISSLGSYSTMLSSGQPPPAVSTTSGQEDTVTISSEAMQKLLTSIPQDVKTASDDLHGDKTNLTQDLQTIGQYFQANGGKAMLDEYMQSHYSSDELTSFQQAAGAAGQPPPSTATAAMEKLLTSIPQDVKAASDDLHGDKTSMIQDLQTIGQYFRSNGGRDVLHAYMESHFSPEERRTFHQAMQSTDSQQAQSPETSDATVSSSTSSA